VRCDLHLHSRVSDGALSPTDVVKETRNGAIDVISLTDHDSMGGVPEALAECRRVTGGPRLIWGVEVSTSIQGREVHVLAYFPARPGASMDRFLELAREQRRDRILQGLTRLRRAADLALSDEEVLDEVSGEVVSRMHIARAMVRRGIVRDLRGAFRTHLATEHGHFSATTVTPAQAISAIHADSGLAIWAHPETPCFEETLSHLVAAGLDGLEIMSRSSGIDERSRQRAADLGLLTSGGSDWHGRGRPPSHGRWHVPAEITRDLLIALGHEPRSRLA